jgi:hypothetical protein
LQEVVFNLVNNALEAKERRNALTHFTPRVRPPRNDKKSDHERPKCDEPDHVAHEPVQKRDGDRPRYAPK